jgi:sulfide:quinone oxidoreductase
VGHWDRIRGLKDHLGTHGICSVYGYDQAARTWDLVRAFDGGRALFTAPSTPYKGGSAPLRLLFRTEEVWRRAGVRDRTELFFATAAPADVVDTEYAELIERSDQQDDIHVFSGYDLVEVRAEAQEAVFRVTKGRSESQDVLRFDFLHVVPPMRPPALLEESGLAHRDGPLKGHLAVDPESLRHRRFETVFGVGDVAGVEGVKTGERAREQGAAVARRLRRLAAPDE